MVYSDREVREWAERNVTPFNDLHVNPGSLDLTLGTQMCRPMWYWRNPITRWVVARLEMIGVVLCPDQKRPERWKRWGEPEVLDTYWLMPGEFVLCHSAEYTKLQRDQIAFLLSKSSWGREGLEHLHAGYGDQAFEGEWTWELINTAPWPIKLEAGKRLMQLVLAVAHVPEKDYSKTGRYQGQVGPTAPR